MIARLIAVFALIGVALAPNAASAWGYFGHRTTADIAMANVRPETRTAIRRLIAHADELGTPKCAIGELADAATWPDCLRGEYWRWSYTFAWHYQTEPVGEDYDAKKNCSGGNCVSAQIERNFRILSDESLPANVRLEALAFMIHFTGDIHMPLHSGDHDDRGGNDVETAYGIVPGLNLHSIWDTALAERAITSANPPLVRRYSAAERGELAGGGPADWGRESWQLARDFVYPNAFDRSPLEGELPDHAALTQEDIVAAVPVVERRITQAGLRMADLLDAAFVPGAMEELP
ncbi:S1/P1 nuclease [Pelagerythrobacter sp.]|uniref:S1/P1 nuclease n=1 Tax=Pelagerythrobacter sp. TaxID=2800702 RepID=UPI0035B02F35